MRNSTTAARTTAFAALVAILVIVPSGCHSDRPGIVPISGQVLVDGQPLAHGMIEFIPKKSRQSHSKLDSEGRFTLTCRDPGDGAVLGEHQIAVSGSEMLPSSTATLMKIMWYAPKKYADAATSGLTEQIAGPRSDLTINLTWDGGKPFVETIRETQEVPEHGGSQSR